VDVIRNRTDEAVVCPSAEVEHQLAPVMQSLFDGQHEMLESGRARSVPDRLLHVVAGELGEHRTHLFFNCSAEGDERLRGLCRFGIERKSGEIGRVHSSCVGGASKQVEHLVNVIGQFLCAHVLGGRSKREVIGWDLHDRLIEDVEAPLEEKSKVILDDGQFVHRGGGSRAECTAKIYGADGSNVAKDRVQRQIGWKNI